MDYDDIQDKKEALFEQRKQALLDGSETFISHTSSVEVEGYTQDTYSSIDDLLLAMHEDLINGNESDKQKAIYLFNQAGNLALNAHQKIASIMIEGVAESYDELCAFLAKRMVDFLIDACRNDDDFVDEAVSHIIGGTAQKFFE